MTDWAELTIRALEELGADDTFARGAKVRHVLHRLGEGEEVDLEGFLESVQKKFGEFLDTVDGAVVQRRPGTDMFVGLRGAQWRSPTPERKRPFPQDGSRLRADVYEALTVVSDRPYYYVRGQDRFTQEIEGREQTDLVKVSPVTLDSLIAERREFADKHADADSRERVKKALNFSANPLASSTVGGNSPRKLRKWPRMRRASFKALAAGRLKTNSAS